MLDISDQLIVSLDYSIYFAMKLGHSIGSSEYNSGRFLNITSFNLAKFAVILRFSSSVPIFSIDKVLDRHLWTHESDCAFVMNWTGFFIKLFLISI